MSGRFDDVRDKRVGDATGNDGVGRECKTCEFNEEKKCHRFPPPNREGTFPLVWDWDWCGEWRKAGDGKVVRFR